MYHEEMNRISIPKIGVHIRVNDPGKLPEINEVFTRWGFNLIEHKLIPYKITIPIDDIEEEYEEYLLVMDFEHIFLSDWSGMPELLDYLKVHNWNATDDYVNQMIMVKMPLKYGEDVIEVIQKLRIFIPESEEYFDWF